MARDFFNNPRRPINKTAAIVLYSEGEHFNSIKKIRQKHWDTPPPMKKYHGPKEKNMCGKKFGRFLVVGYFGTSSGKASRRALWVVRCSCGSYETRSSKSITNPSNTNDCCDNCRQLEYLKSR